MQKLKTINVGIKLNKTQKTIIETIKSNPQCTIDEIAKIALVEKRTIERNVKTLKEKGILERVGAKKDGIWVIKNNNL